MNSSYDFTYKVQQRTIKCDDQQNKKKGQNFTFAAPRYFHLILATFEISNLATVGKELYK